MAPLSLETEPLADQQAEQVPDETQSEESPVRLFGGGLVDETDAGPITPEELRDGATSATVDEPAADEPKLDPEPEQTDPKPPPPRKTPDDAAAKLREITRASEDVREARERVALLKDDLKTAKEDLQGSVNRLMRLTAAVSNDEARPLIQAAESKAESASVVEATADEPAAAPAEPTATTTADAWRSYRFDDPKHFPALASQKAIVAKLAENGIETIGQMVDFQKPSESGWCKAITDIKGIGKGKAEKIELALETFWAEHPDIVQAAVDAS